MERQDHGRDSGEDQSEGRIKNQIKKFEELVRYQGNDRIVTWPDYLSNREKNVGKTVKLSSGFAELDYFTEGFATGELITISGYTGMGKTLFLKSLMRSFGINQVPVLCLSYEDSVERYLEKFKQEGADYTIYPITVPNRLQTGDLGWLEERVTEAQLKFNARVVTIDHLHYLMDMGQGRENMSLKIGSIMRFLKTRIAEEHNMIVFVVAHQEKLREGCEEASINTIRDSSLIGQESDSVIIVQRMPDDKNQKRNEETYELGTAMVKVDKARRAGTFRKRLTFQKSGDWLVPL